MLMNRAERRGTKTGEWTISMRDGTRLVLPRESRMTWKVAVDQEYDSCLLDAMEEYLLPETTIVDVGASLGLWTVQLAALAAQRGGLVHAFEPNPNNIPWLTRNLAINELSDIVTIHPIGLGEQEGEVGFASIDGDVGNGYVTDGYVTAHDDRPAPMRVPIRRLDDLSIVKPVSFIKLDVEGFEPAVLRGAASLLKRDQPTIYGEFSAWWLAHRNEDLGSLLDTIRYRAVQLRFKRSRAWRPIDTVSVAPAGEVDSSLEDLLLLPRWQRAEVPRSLDY